MIKYENKSKIKLLITDTDSSIYEIETQDVCEEAIKKCLILIIIQPSQNTMMMQTN